MSKVRRQAGFTLIELLVAILIIAISSAIVLWNWRSGEKNLALQRSSHQLAQDVREVQEWTLGARDLTGPTGEKVLPSGGYGVYFSLNDNGHYTVFADCDADEQLDISGTPCGTSPNQFAETIEIVSLEEGVTISNLSPSSLNALHVTFRAPDPTTYFYPTASSVSITVVNEEGKSRAISINEVGLVAIQ